MFLYSEHFAGKTPNEVISFLKFYLEKIDLSFKILYIFSDNAFFQCKSRYIWLFFLTLIRSQKLDEINVIYPLPGHSYLDCDRDFGRIEKNRLKIEKVSLPSEYVNLIKNTDIKFNVNYVNFPLTDDLECDGTDIIIVKDFKKYFDNFLVNNVEQLKEVRKIRFNKTGVYGTKDLLSENFNIKINLIKSNLELENLNLENLDKAYDNFKSIKYLKYQDIKKLLNYVVLAPNVKFYQSLVPEKKVLHVSKSKLRAYQVCLIESYNCKCNGKCMRSCNCKNNSKICDEKCSCNSKICKNK
jgi:hypothetical protein